MSEVPENGSIDGRALAIQSGIGRLRIPNILDNSLAGLIEPKRQLAEYIEREIQRNGGYVGEKGRNGWNLLVPRRFSTLEEAIQLMESGEISGIHLRSEDDQAFDGMSGIFPTWKIRLVDGLLEVKKELGNYKTYSIDEIANIIGEWENEVRYIKSKYSLEGIRTGYSLWETKGNQNFAIVADSGVRGKYYFYDIDGQVFVLEGDKARNDELIKAYEWIRARGVFPAGDSPIVEFSSDGNDIYFLQYLRTQPQDIVTFSLDAIPRGYIEVDFVRGVTGPDGIIVELVPYNYTGEKTHNGYYCQTGIGGLRESSIIIQKKLQNNPSVWVIGVDENSFNDGNESLLGLSTEHIGRSVVHKSRIFIALKASSWNNGKYEQLFRDDDGEIKRLHIISDGKRAYIKRI